MASAVCVLVGTEGVSGTVTFTAEGGATKVSGEITGLVRSPLRFHRGLRMGSCSTNAARCLGLGAGGARLPRAPAG